MTGLKIQRLNGNGSNLFYFSTVDHKHGWWDRDTNRWDLYTSDDFVFHFTSCWEFFPDDMRRVKP